MNDIGTPVADAAFFNMNDKIRIRSNFQL